MFGGLRILWITWEVSLQHINISQSFLKIKDIYLHTARNICVETRHYRDTLGEVTGYNVHAIQADLKALEFEK